MIKLLMMIIFMWFIFKMNYLKMYNYNFSFLLSFIMLFFYINLFDSMNWSSLSFMIGMDSYSYFLIILTCWIIGLMFMSLSEKDLQYNLYLFFMLMLIIIFFFMIMNLLIFYLLFEMSLLPIFIMIIMKGYNFERFSASLYLLMYMMLVSFPLLVYIMFINLMMGSLDFYILMWKESLKLNFWSYVFIFMVFYIKLPLYIFHIWLPKAHVEAPVYGSMILAAVLLKLGGYGLIRMIMIFMNMMLKFNYIMISIGLVGSFIVSIICLIQIDMKSLIAYSSIVHMNMMMCSLLMLMKVGIISAYYMMIMHGLCSSGLFYMVGIIYKWSMSRLMLINKGLLNLMVGMSVWWFYFCVTNFAFPLSVSFLSEIFMLMIILEWEISLMLILMLICFFSSAYSLYLFSYIFHGYWCLWKKFNSSNFKEYMILINHCFPILLFLFNLMMLL